MIILNAGLVHRVGPNRLHVHLARCLAEQGFLSVRFDFSGIGDSPADIDHLPFEQRSVSETQQVMDSVSERTGISRFCLMGLCSGAVTSFNIACRDPRVAGVVLLNARGIGGAGAWEQYAQNSWQIRDYLKKLLEPNSFFRAVRKTVTGNMEPYKRLFNAVRGYFQHSRKKKQEFDEVVLDLANGIQILINRQVQQLWLCSDGDCSSEYLQMIAQCGYEGIENHECINQVTIDRANHTFDSIPAQQQVLKAIEQWATSCWPE